MFPFIVFLARFIWAGRVNRKQCRQSLWTRSTLLNPSSKKRCCVMTFGPAGDRRVWSVGKVVHQVSWKLFLRFQTRMKIHVITSYVKFVHDERAGETGQLRRHSLNTFTSRNSLQRHVNATKTCQCYMLLTSLFTCLMLIFVFSYRGSCLFRCRQTKVA